MRGPHQEAGKDPKLFDNYGSLSTTKSFLECDPGDTWVWACRTVSIAPPTYTAPFYNETCGARFILHVFEGPG